MGREFAPWMERTATAVDVKENGRSRIEYKAGTDREKRKLVKLVLEESLFYWNFLKIDKALNDVALSLDLKVAPKWLSAVNGTVRVDPQDSLYKRALESITLKNEDSRTLSQIGIGTRVWDNKTDGFTCFYITLRTGDIYVGSSQPDPAKGDRSYQVSVSQNLGNPLFIRSPAIFRDRLDGYLENLITNYPTFYPKKSE